MEASEALNSLIASSPLLMSLAPFYFLLKGQITKDVVSKDELEKILSAFKVDVEKAQADDKQYLHTLDKRSQENAKGIERILGKLS